MWLSDKKRITKKVFTKKEEKKERTYLHNIRYYISIVSVIFFVLSIIFFGKGYNVKNNYNNSGDPYIDMDGDFDLDENNNSNAYVGGDAYNYIINGTYFTGYTIIGAGCLLSGIILFVLIINLTIKIKEYEEITIESVQKKNDRYIIYKRKIDKKN